MAISSTKKPKLKAGTARKKTRRSYDNTLRSQKSVATQQAIIETLVRMLTERKGAQVGMEEIAERLGISERSIFRFFKDKESMHLAMDQYLFTYLQASADTMASETFVGFGKSAYKLFDNNAGLVMAYLFSPFGLEARQIFRKKLNKSMAEKILNERQLVSTPEREKRLALILSLVNAKIWYDIQQDYGFSGSEMAESVEWALKTLTDHL